MTIAEFMEELNHVEGKYNNIEDQNYYLVHKMADMIANVNDEDIVELRTMILQKYRYEFYSPVCEYACCMSKENLFIEAKTNEPQYDCQKEPEITSIFDFYRAYDDNLIRYIKGHLFLEFAMNAIIKKALNLNKEAKTFAYKIGLLSENSLLSENDTILLKAINKQRNKIAHDLNYLLTFDTVFSLVKLSSEAGVDYSDDTIFKNMKLSKEWYGIDGIINELFPNTFCHLLYNNEKYFIGDEIFNLMT